MSTAQPPPTAGGPAAEGPHGFRERWVYRHRLTRLAYRALVALAGSVVVVVGLLLVPLPGPGWLIVFLGLGILASEFAWAAGVLAYARRTLAGWSAWLGRQTVGVRMLVAAASIAAVAGGLAIYARLWGIPEWVPLV